MPRQIDHAIHASQTLIRNIHTDGMDRGSILTFGDNLSKVQGFNADLAELYSSLDCLPNPTGCTRLYDSICDTVYYFRSAASHARPWFTVVVTDGYDNRSTVRKHAKECGEFVLQNYNFDPTNFIFIVSVGDSIRNDKLDRLAYFAKCSHVPIRSFDLLEQAFLQIAIQVTNALTGAQLTVGNTSWLALHEQKSIEKIAIDYCILLDISGSMNIEVHGIQPINKFRCFKGHVLKPHRYATATWFCNVCNASATSSLSMYHCNICGFDCCLSHCEGGIIAMCRATCEQSHKMQYMDSADDWICDECRREYHGERRLRCDDCDYDNCEKCLDYANALNAINLLKIEEL
mmetsp:Transcript_5755/g.16483  ORF Transcript_5755/g.16483 Transcript_5755/m.16483 type:complete len:346 (-) Transcript_5755:906-1943(-)